jgi:enamine deaminase RidA (YjgF/YER057c/UK114 family)
MAMSDVESGTRMAIAADGSPPLVPHAPAIKAGNWLFVSGHQATDWGPGGLAEPVRANPNMPYLHVAQRRQSAYLLEQVDRLCRKAGTSFDDHSVRIYQWFVAPDQERDGGTWSGDDFTITPYLEERDHFLTHDRPASTGMGINELLIENSVVEMDVILKLDTPKAQVDLDVPMALAGYSQGLVSGDWVFTAGEHATDFNGDWEQAEYRGPKSAIQFDARTPSELFWYGLPIRLQTRKLFEKLERNLEACGSSMKDVVHATLYYGHPRQIAELEEAWREWFPEDPPARTLIPYMGIGVRDCNPEIALIALKKDGATRKQTVMASGVPAPIGHEPHAVKAGDLLFFSTQIAGSEAGLCDGGARSAAYPFFGSPARAQMHGVLENMSAICEAAGTSLANLCRTQAFHASLASYHEAMEEWRIHWPEGEWPAGVSVGLGGDLHIPGALFLLDAIAHCP